ncbi:unnamed protein product [Kluyveromyces dobzhanskii CBS 2104]|uniref:WGS project CCBQ000000000 data, contig 00102 n=1 Tax=Kluyveromyces dobzhanskii CBS 2104 TaxID=1427455 RepID=A0A0A8L663_9SACH|nr:unnamed protein product [Kluyveromyces dobzhanskii CBS 2104]
MHSIKADHPCTVCQKRKVKCDRKQPACQNCIERDEVELCTYDENRAPKRSRLTPAADKFESQLLFLWREYEKLWIRDTIGQCQNNTGPSASLLMENFDESSIQDFFGTLFSKDSVFEILDYSLQRYGWLFFGFFTDISELPFKMEEFWDDFETGSLSTQERDITAQQVARNSSLDNLLWELILRSVITMTIYYMPSEGLISLVNKEALRKLQLDHSDSDSKSNAVKVHYNIFHHCLKFLLKKILRTIFTLPADIKTLQIFLILSNTSFLNIYPSLGNNMLVHCIHLVKILNIKDFKLRVNDSAYVRLQKLTMHNIWFRLSSIDYTRSTPNKLITLHTENSSILNRKNLMNDYSVDSIDVYDVENNSESLRWKLTSLERDLEETTPSLKTLQLMKDLIINFDERLPTVTRKSSPNIRFENFILKLHCSFVLWKVLRCEYTQFGFAHGLQKLCLQTNRITSLVSNFIQEGFLECSAHPLCSHVLCVLIAFHSFYCIFHDSKEVSALVDEALILLSILSEPMQITLNSFFDNISRFQELKTLWNSVEIADQIDKLVHPTLYILKNDIVHLRNNLNHKSYLLKGSQEEEMLKDEQKIILSPTVLSSAFLEIVKEFDLGHPLNI